MRCYPLILLLWRENGKLTQQTTILVKTFGIFCVSGDESGIQVVFSFLFSLLSTWSMIVPPFQLFSTILLFKKLNSTLGW